MKLFFVLAALYVSSMKFTLAQNFNAFAFGGVAASQVSGDALGGFDKAGIIFGAGVETPVSKNLAMSFEISYLQKGSRKPSKLDQGDPSQYLLRLNYLEVPLTLSYHLNKNVDVSLGAAAGYLVSSLEENENGELILKLPFKTLDISATGGVSYRFDEHFKATLRGIQSVLPVREFGGKVSPFFNAGQYNSVVVLMLGYYFKSLKDEQ